MFIMYKTERVREEGRRKIQRFECFCFELEDGHVAGWREDLRGSAVLVRHACSLHADKREEILVLLHGEIEVTYMYTERELYQQICGIVSSLVQAGIRAHEFVFIA